MTDPARQDSRYFGGARTGDASCLRHSTMAVHEAEDPRTPIPPIVAVPSLKGGVGKTSVLLGLAGEALDRSLRTLVIDLDPQANATSALDPRVTPYTSNDVLYDARPGIAAEAVVPSGWGRNVAVIPSERALEHRANVVSDDSALRLRRSLQGVVSGYDLVLIDCPPSLGELTRNALYAANQALIVTEPSYFAVQGAEQALEAVSIIARHSNHDLSIAGIAVNRMRPTLSEHLYRLDELRAAFGSLVVATIPDRSATQLAQGACVPVQRWTSYGAGDMTRAFDTLLTSVMGAASINPEVAVPAHPLGPALSHASMATAPGREESPS